MRKGMGNRDGIGNAAIVVEMPIDLDRTAETGKRAGRHDRAVIIPDDIIFGKIDGTPGLCIGCRHIKFRRVAHDRRIIDRVGTIGIGKRAVNILQPEKISGVDQTVNTEITRVIQMFCIKTKITSALSGEIGQGICRSGRNPDAVIKINMVI